MPVYKHCIFLITLSLSTALVAYSEIIEFEKFVSPDGPWGRQPILLDEDGGFSNILVAIHADVKESEIDLETITGMFSNVSQILVDTRKQYLREISILIPDNWKSKPEYEQIRPNQTLQTARVIIRNETSIGMPPSYPFVRRFSGGCGEEGEYIYLPYGNLTSEKSFTQADTMIELWELLLADCVSIAGRERKKTAEQSLAPGPPSFRLLKRRNELNVVILDARETMQDNKKFSRMMEKFEYYIWHLFPTYSWLGIVTATDTVKKMVPCLKLWESPNFRQSFLLRSNVPQCARGSSSLADAVVKALEVLKERRADVSGSRIFVMSDGTDVNSTLDGVYELVASAGVILASLPFSQNASENIQLNHTINENFTVSDLDMLYRLEDQNIHSRILALDMQEVDDLKPLNFPVDGDISNRAALVRIKCNNAASLNVSGFCENSVCLPDEIVFTEEYLDAVFYSETLDELEINSLVKQKISLEVFSTFLGPVLTYDQSIYVNEEIKARAIFKSIVVNFTTVEEGVSLFTILTKNERPVINVSLVEANAIFPDGMTARWQLTDNGRDADESINDGSYSGNFNDFTIEGDYSVAVLVRSGNRSCIANVNTNGESVGGCDVIPYFEQYISAQTFTVIGIPPSPIDDVTITSVKIRTVNLEWTAPGEDFMIGKAARYDVRFSKSEDSQDFDLATPVTFDSLLSGAVTSPQEALSSESIELHFSENSGAVFYITIKTIDSSGNVADVSNVAKVVFEEIKEETVDEKKDSLSKVSLIDTVKGVMGTPSFIGAVSVIGVVILCIFLIQWWKHSKGSSSSVIFLKSSQSRVTPEVVRRSDPRGPAENVIIVEDF